MCKRIRKPDGFTVLSLHLFLLLEDEELRLVVHSTGVAGLEFTFLPTVIFSVEVEDTFTLEGNNLHKSEAVF